jgi:hypothetical protein
MAAAWASFSSAGEPPEPLLEARRGSEGNPKVETHAKKKPGSVTLGPFCLMILVAGHLPAKKTALAA